MMGEIESLIDIPGWYKKAGPENDVVLSSRIRFARNLAGFPFPEKLILKDEQRIHDEIFSAFQVVDKGKRYIRIRIGDLSLVERQMLFEKKLISRDFSGKLTKSVLLRKDNSASCMINEQDHLRFSVFTGGLELQSLFHEVKELFDTLEQTLNFAVSLEFGYLNSLVRNSGTGMKASVMLHLPFLVRTSLFDRAIKSSVTEGFSVKGFMGDDDNSLGDIYQISNELSLGLSEEEYIKRLYDITATLTEYERRAREQYGKSKSTELEDIFYRSYGLLKNCRLLSLKEIVKNITDFRIGIIMGWADVPLEQINALLILSQKAHIQYVIGDESDSDSKNIDYVRSELAKAYLKLLQ